MIAKIPLCRRIRAAHPKGLGAIWLAIFMAVSPCAFATEKHPTLAQPSRPVTLPTLPGGVEATTESGLMLHVTSMEEEAEKKQAEEDSAKKKAAESASKPASTLPADNEQNTGGYSEQNWRPAKQQAQHTDGEQPDHAPLRVRLPGLPDSHVTIAPVDKGPSAAEANRAALLEEYKHAKDLEAAHEREEKAARAGKKKEDKSPAEAAACEALQAYKERQLNAIKSDNETLKALQDAISSLGYEKQLNYMRSSGDMTGNPEATTPQTETKPAAKSGKTKKPTS